MRKQTHKFNKNWQKPVLLSTAATLSALGQAGLAQEEASDELPPVMVISQAPETETQSVTLLSGDTITLTIVASEAITRDATAATHPNRKTKQEG